VSVVKFKPTSAGKRGTVKVKPDNLWKGRPLRKLLERKKTINGRNSLGHITTRHRGGGHKRLYRLIDFKRNKDSISHIVSRIEYDPNRSCLIALVTYSDGDKRYILSNKGLKVGDKLLTGSSAPIVPGNCLPLRSIPVGTTIFSIESKPGKGSQFARSAGTYAQLLAKEGIYAQIKLRSGEIRYVHIDCRATIGEASNTENNLKKLGKAGAKRWRGYRPTVRGVAMNPIDHPHGGGEGRTGTKRHPVSPWGQLTKGFKTRSNKKTDYLIIKRKSKSRG